MAYLTSKLGLKTQTESTVRWCIAAWGILLGTASVVAAFYTTSHTLIQYPYEDMWNIVEELGIHHGRFSLPLLWSQHNEHRIPFARLAQQIDLFWFRGKNNSLYFEVYALQFFNLFVWSYVLRKVAAWQTWLVSVGCGLAAFALFWVSQYQSLTPLGISILPGSGFGILAIFAVSLGAVNASRRLAWLIAGSAAAFVCEGTLANGMLLWPLLLILAVRLRLGGKYVALLGAIGTTAIFIYIWDYQTPPALVSPVKSLSHPAAVVQYFLTYLGGPWYGMSPLLARSLAVMGTAVVGVSYIRELMNDNPRIFPLSVLSIGIFALVSGVVTALGRVSLGVQQALSSRYQSSILLFWLCIAVYGLHVFRSRGTGPAMLIAVTALAADTVILPSFPTALHGARAYTRGLDEGALPIFSDVRDPGETQNKLSVPIRSIYEQRPWLQGLNSAYYANSKYLHLDWPLTSVFHVTGKSRCSGAAERIERLADQSFPGWTVTGWAWDRDRNAPVEEIVTVSENQVIIGSGLSAESSVNGHTGWHAYLRGGQAIGNSAIYGVVDGGRSACLVAWIPPGP